MWQIEVKTVSDTLLAVAVTGGKPKASSRLIFCNFEFLIFVSPTFDRDDAALPEEFSEGT